MIDYTASDIYDREREKNFLILSEWKLAEQKAFRILKIKLCIVAVISLFAFLILEFFND